MLIENDIHTIIDIISLDDEEIKAIYSSTTKIKPKQHLTMSQINGIKYLKYYNINQCKNHGPFLLRNWLKVTREEFELFRISCNPFDYKEAQPKTPPTNTFPTHDPIKDFMRGVKRDASIFPKLKDEKQWNDWYNRTKAQARSQFMDEIFDIKYKPGSVDEINLFDLKKILFYVFFTNTLLTDKGTSLVSQYEGAYNTYTIQKNWHSC